MWSAAPQSLSLSEGEVHVWRAELEQPHETLESFDRILDTDERERASRFHFEKHRRRFVVARGILRTLLARYLNAQPEELRFSYTGYGKPALDVEHRRVRFNASHSHELALFAFVLDHEIGVDVEHVNRDFASEEIARRYFSASEVETFNKLSKEEQPPAFFRCWTRKEAYIKAIGEGLSHPLDAFDVTFAPGEPARLLRVARDPESVARWSMADLDVGSAYAAAVAVQGISAIRVQTYDCHSL
jgi:4'-phosphopantetheinyl transferase